MIQVQSYCFASLGLLPFLPPFSLTAPSSLLTSTRGSKSCVRIGYPNLKDEPIPWPPPPAPPPTRDYRQTKIWFYRQFCNRGKLDQESWSPVLGIFSTWNSTIHSNFLQLVTPSLLVERRSTEFGVCGTKALNSLQFNVQFTTLLGFYYCKENTYFCMESKLRYGQLATITLLEAGFSVQDNSCCAAWMTQGSSVKRLWGNEKDKR